MKRYRQTNHNGRTNAISGHPYTRKHNDRQYDITAAENIREELAHKNVIIHYDCNNKPSIIKYDPGNMITIDSHEQTIYDSLFKQSLSAQNARNCANRHPERNKTINDLLGARATCPEETIIQIGSTMDGHPDPDILLAIYTDYQQQVVAKYGQNIHFLDAVMHLDETVPHIHVRRVWIYDDKDGPKISQTKALNQMGFVRPHPDKSPTKWNNAKVTYSSWDRELQSQISQVHGLSINDKPLYAGKQHLTQTQAVCNILQAKNERMQIELARKKENLKSANAKIAQNEAEYEKIQNIANQLAQKEQSLTDQSLALDRREKNIEEEIQQSISSIIREKLTDFFIFLLSPITKYFTGTHQDEVVPILRNVPVDHDTAQQLKKLNYPGMEGKPISAVLSKAESRDIRHALHESGVEYNNIDSCDISLVRKQMVSGRDIDMAAETIAAYLACTVQHYDRD